MTKHFPIVALVTLLAGCEAAEIEIQSGDTGPEITAADYEAAAALLQGNLKGLVKNATVEPHWLSGTTRFWYKRDGDSGPEYRVVDTASGEHSSAFDQGAIATALSSALDTEIEASALGLGSESLTPNLATLTAVRDGKVITCNLEENSCEASDPPVPPAGALTSSTGRYILQAEDHNLVLTEVASQERHQLTDDGEPHRSWGKLPDTGLMVVQIKKHGMRLPPVGAQFSPDDRYVVASLNDEREVGVVPFVEWVPTDGSMRPVVHEVRHPLTGDTNRPDISLWSFDLSTGERTQIEFPEDYYFGGLDGNVLGWSKQHGQAFIAARTMGSKKLALFRADLASGAVTKLIEDASDTRAMTNTVEYNKPNIRLLADGAEVIWYSDQSGWGHLYLHDAQTGERKNVITQGDWLVQDIHAVDEANREVYFTGGAREAGRDPYFRHLYRASFDGGEPVLLTAENADHTIPPVPTEMFAVLFSIPALEPMIRPDLGVFLDTWSTVDTPPQTALRSTEDGSLIAMIETADASAIYERGWRPPVRQAVKAADGVTDIYTVYYPPKMEMLDSKHPVIDAVYGGPQVIVAPRNFMDAVTASNPLGSQSLSRLGFAVVTTDGRGTPLRSNAFRDAGYIEFTRIGIEDHIAAIEQLATIYPQMDTSRVGIHGWSWGGTFTAQAMLSQPDFYDVGITGAGVYDYAPLYPGFESATGVPEYDGGGTVRTRPDEKPSNWTPLDITSMAPNLKGKMLIVYGDMDENVPQAQAFRLVDALIKANKPYDMLYLPNRTHSGGGEGYVQQRNFDYFVEHLHGVEPPADVTVTMAPLRG